LEAFKTVQIVSGITSIILENRIV